MNRLAPIVPRSLRPIWASLAGPSIGGRLARGAFWSLVGTLLSRTLALASSILVARMLGKTVYGELGMIQSTLGMFGVLAGFGMGTTACKYVSEFRGANPERAGRIIGLSTVVSWSASLLLALAVVGLAPWLCERVIVAPHLKPYLQMSSLLLLLGGVNGAQLGVLSGFEAFRTIAYVNALAGVLTFVLSVAGALYFGLPGILWGMIVSQAGGCVLNRYGLRREMARYGISPQYRSVAREWSTFWHFSVPAILGSLMLSPVGWVCSTLLVRQPRGYEEMGTLSAANQWFGALMWLPNILGQVVLPILSERYGTRDMTRSFKLLRVAILLNGAVVFPLVAVGSLASPYIMLGYGREFADAWPTLVVVLITAGLVAVEAPVGQLISATGRMWVGLGMNIGQAVVWLVGTWLMVGWGAFGVASARLVCYAVHGIWTFGFAYVVIRRAAAAGGPAAPSQPGCDRL